MSEFIKLVKEKGSAIRCEAEMSEGFGHAGLIVLVEEDKERAILGRTDPTFKTAKQAVDAMKDTVDSIRNGVPDLAAEEEPEIPPAPPVEEPKKEVPKRKRKRKPRKRKGGEDA